MSKKHDKKAKRRILGKSLPVYIGSDTDGFLPVPLPQLGVVTSDDMIFIPFTSYGDAATRLQMFAEACRQAAEGLPWPLHGPNGGDE